MKAYEIKGWNEGKKIRRCPWAPASYIKMDPNCQWFMHDEFRFTDLGLLFSANDWEPYEEPRKKRKVRLYRAIYDGDYGISISQWHEQKQFSRFIIGYEEREIEVDCE